MHLDIFVKVSYSDVVNLGCNYSHESIKIESIISLHLNGIVLAFDKSSTCLSLKLLVILVTYSHRSIYFQNNTYQCLTIVFTFQD